MPLLIDKNLPARKILEAEDIFTMDKARARAQDIRPVRLAILNLMPNKEETETQLLRSLANSPLQIHIDLISLDSHRPKNTSQEYLREFYKSFSQIKNLKYDGLIITGAPVEKLEFEKVSYWEELEEVFDYASKNIYSTMFICWASQAALYYYYGIKKYRAREKIFGIYQYEIRSKSRLTRDFDDIFSSPQSRYSLNKIEDIEANQDLVLLAGDKETGMALAKSQDNRFIFVAGHGEYDRTSLYKEYLRDLDQGMTPKLPKNYLDDQGQIRLQWRSSNSLLFSNWLNYYIYQATLYNIEAISEKKVLKFGGSSLSDSQQFIKVKNIVKSQASRNLIVVSAPGKRYAGDFKITDLLIAYSSCKDLEEGEKLLDIIGLRYKTLVGELGLGTSLLDLIDLELGQLKNAENSHYIISRGEYLSAYIMASFLGFKFIDARDLIFFKGQELDKARTYESIRRKILPGQGVVVPGFYGQDENKAIKTFSRGGSDITGSIIASALKVDIYENWTDVDGLMNKDPNKYQDAKLIDNLSYIEFLKISLNGDQIYNIDAIDWVMEDKIPINIRNTNRPRGQGTIIGGKV